MEHSTRTSWAGITLKVFLPWYFVEMPMKIICGYWTYTRTIAQIFSFTFLIRTLWYPWKNIRDGYTRNLFDFGSIAQSFVLNSTARIIGFLFRSVTIAMGLAFEALCLAIFVVILFLWITFPFLIVIELCRLLTLAF